MAKITNRNELWKWLDGKPREAMVAIAVRAALRVAPLVAKLLPPGGGQGRAESFLKLTSAVFRCYALARAAGKYPARANELRAAAAYAAATAATAAAYAAATAATAAAYAAGNAANAAATAGNAANAAATAATATANAATATANAATATAATATAATAADAATATAATAADALIWESISRDVEWIERGQSLGGLIETSIWFDAIPSWAVEHWGTMRAALPDDQHWQVWIDWYEARLAGRPTSEAYDLAFVKVPEEEWRKGPAAGNAWIAANLAKLPKETLRDIGDILARIRKDPAGAPIRIVNGKAAIESNESDDDFAIAAQPQTQQLLARARVRAAAAREHAFKLSNQRGFENIASDVDEFSRLLSGDANLLAENISIAWELSSSIGAFAERDEEVKSGRGGLTPQMDAGPREAIDQLLTASAALIRRFPTAREHDEAVRISRQPRESLAPTKEIFESAKSGALLEKSTERVLGSAIDAGERSDGVQAEKNRAFASGTTRSMIVAFMVGGSAYAMSLGGKFVEGAVTKAGEHFYEHSAIGETIDRFLLEKEKEIAELFKDLPADVRSAIREVLRRIREGKPPPSPPRVDPTTSV